MIDTTTVVNNTEMNALLAWLGYLTFKYLMARLNKPATKDWFGPKPPTSTDSAF